MTAPILFYGRATASTALYLDGLAPDLAASVALLEPTDPARDLPRLAGAGLVVLVRGLEIPWRSGLVAALAGLGVPCAWFTDDDLTALRGEQPGFGFYTEPRVRRVAAGLAACIGTTRPLAARLGAFHPRMLHWPCVLDARALPPPGPRLPGPLRIAAVGGGFRAAGLRSLVLPALAALPPHALLLAEPLAAGIAAARRLPFEPAYGRFLDAWRREAPDILVHPPGHTANLAGKGPGVLLVAASLGSVPVVAAEPAFAGLGPEQGVLVAAEDAVAWREALACLADPAARAALRSRLLAHLHAACPPDGPRAAVAGLLALAAPMGEAARARQQAAARQGWRPRLSWRLARRLHRLASHGR